MKIIAGVDSIAFTSDYDGLFKKYSKKWFGPGFDWKWFRAQAIAESGINPKAVSWCGARGVMQIMPATFKEITKTAPWIKSIDDPEQNIEAGIFYDQKLFKIWSSPRPPIDRLAFMFASYNAGSGNILKAQKLCKVNPNAWASIVGIARYVPSWKYRETIGYVARIMALMEK